MTNRQRMKAVLEGHKPDRMPFMFFSELLPRGQFEREIRNRGVGIIMHTSSVSLDRPGVETMVLEKDGIRTEIIPTPLGELTARYKTGMHNISGSGLIQTEYFVKEEKDYEPMIWLLDHTQFSINSSGYFQAEMLLGDEGMTHAWTDEPPYMGLQYLLGYLNWSLHQYDYPDLFQALLDAYERMQMRRFDILVNAPQNDLINIGNLSGNFSPAKYEQYMKPYFDSLAERLRRAGKSVTIHADALNLMEHIYLMPGPWVNVIEAFTPPPVGNLSLAEARRAWGEETTIWINFPEAVFYDGYEATYRYMIDLLHSDPCPNKFVSFTEIGLLGMDSDKYPIFQAGIRAIIDAIEQEGYY